ncbi:MAG: class I SAM-dependent methyltransferase [Bryobacteraceae bacterium]
MLREPILIDCGDYVVAQGRDVEEGSIATYPLFTDESIASVLTELRAMLARDETAKAEGVPASGPVVDGLNAFAGMWFQRTDFPEHKISSVFDRRWPIFDEGGVNTLGSRLTSEEASLLRPWPKWMYLRPLMPVLQGKTILEVGSANGFFPFRFAEMGASHAMGLEVRRQRYESSVFAHGVLGYKNVELRRTDFLVDFTIPAHDVVFASEVVNHMLCPLWGLARLASLAKEWLIFDTGVFDTRVHSMELSTGWAKGAQLPGFLSFQVTDGLICSYLNVLGIRYCDIEKYVEHNAGHILYRINTRHMHERIASGEISESLLDSMSMNYRLPAAG